MLEYYIGKQYQQRQRNTFCTQKLVLTFCTGKIHLQTKVSIEYQAIGLQELVISIMLILQCFCPQCAFETASECLFASLRCLLGGRCCLCVHVVCALFGFLSFVEICAAMWPCCLCRNNRLAESTILKC